MARKRFTEHPEFLRASGIASAALESAMKEFGVYDTFRTAIEFDGRVDALADDLTRALLAMADKKLLTAKKGRA